MSLPQMRPLQLVIAGVALIVLAQPVSALADSDGYFCVGHGYLAYETRVAEKPARHLLHLVWFGPERGIVRSPPIPLDDFQVHGMSCGAREIEVQGWEVAYSVDIANPASPEITRQGQAKRRCAWST